MAVIMPIVIPRTIAKMVDAITSLKVVGIAALMESMTGGPGYSEEFTPFTAKFGQADDAVAAEYGPYFNDGTDKMPARPILNFTPEQGLLWQRAAKNFVREEYHHSGLGNRMYNTPLTEGNANLASGAPIPVD